MKYYKSHNQKLKGIAKDIIIAIIAFSIFAFINLEIASFVAAISISILLTRRIILDLNPGFIAGHKIEHNGKQLVIPKGVDVFELKDSSSFGVLLRYVEILEFITVPPRVMIIRFHEVLFIDSDRVQILEKAMKKLSKKNIKVLFSDLDWNLLNQLKLTELYNIVGARNICDDITQALVVQEKKW